MSKRFNPLRREEPPQDIEQLAAQARAEREREAAQAFTTALEKIVADHECNPIIAVQVGANWVALQEVLRLPVQIVFVAKPPNAS